MTPLQEALNDFKQEFSLTDVQTTELLKDYLDIYTSTHCSPVKVEEKDKWSNKSQELMKSV